MVIQYLVLNNANGPVTVGIPKPCCKRGGRERRGQRDTLTACLIFVDFTFFLVTLTITPGIRRVPVTPAKSH